MAESIVRGTVTHRKNILGKWHVRIWPDSGEGPFDFEMDGHCNVTTDDRIEVRLYPTQPGMPNRAYRVTRIG